MCCGLSLSFFSIALVCLSCKVVGFACTRNARTVQTGQSPAIGCGCHWDRAIVAWGRRGNTVAAHRAVWGRDAATAHGLEQTADIAAKHPPPSPPTQLLTVTSSQLFVCACTWASEWRHLYPPSLSVSFNVIVSWQHCCGPPVCY